MRRQVRPYEIEKSQHKNNELKSSTKWKSRKVKKKEVLEFDEASRDSDEAFRVLILLISVALTIIIVINYFRQPNTRNMMNKMEVSVTFYQERMRNDTLANRETSNIIKTPNQIRKKQEIWNQDLDYRHEQQYKSSQNHNLKYDTSRKPMRVASEEDEVAPPLPSRDNNLAGYKNIWDPHEDTDQPVFWHIPKAGGSTIKDIMGTCHRFTQASEAGIVDGHDQDTVIAVVRPGNLSPFVNVDTTKIPGIERAKSLGLAESNLADFIVSPHIRELEQIFTPKARGRLFGIFRHPVDRAVSMFYYTQIAHWGKFLLNLENFIAPLTILLFK